MFFLRVSHNSCCKSIPRKVVTVQQPTLETLSNIAYRNRITIVKNADKSIFLSFRFINQVLTPSIDVIGSNTGCSISLAGVDAPELVPDDPDMFDT